jgi:hypothetical protein
MVEVLVNKALQDFVESRFGARAWEAVRDRTGARIETYESDEPHLDEVTLELLRETASLTGLTLEQALEGFGEQWAFSTMSASHGEAAEAGFMSLREFLLGSGLAIPGLSFSSSESAASPSSSGGPLHIEYRSINPGMSPLVRGVVRGAARAFGTSVDVRSTKAAGEGVDHDELVVRFPEN